MIRKTLDTDIPAVMAIYDAARALCARMATPRSGPRARLLPSNWLPISPPVAAMCAKLTVAWWRLFAFYRPDECYDVIEDGQWRSDTPYAVLHRVASDGTVHGIAAAMFAFAKERADHLRIDTHRDNLPMQGASIKAGFERAGVVYVSDGTARVAFDWLREA